MKTKFNYEENNYMKNEINSMSNSKRKNIFKLMRLIGNFNLKCNLYLESFEEEENTRIMTYDKNGNKITFYPRSTNEQLEELVFRKNNDKEVAYLISDVTSDCNIENLKAGDVYNFINGKVLINKVATQSFVEIMFYDGVTYKSNILLADFDEKKFLSFLPELEDVEFSDFINIVCECTKNYSEYYNLVEFECLGQGLEITKINIQNKNVEEFVSLEDTQILKRTIKSHNFTLNE